MAWPPDFSPIQPVLLGVEFAGIALLLVGFFLKGRRSNLVRAAGWLLFALYWPFQAPDFFWPKDTTEPDPINGWFTLLGPLFLVWVAWHEYRSYQWNEDPRALRWFAGASAISAATYFTIYQVPGVAAELMRSTAQQSAWLYNVLFSHASGHTAYVPTTSSTTEGFDICLTGQPCDLASGYAVTVVLACTAIQSMMIFVGAIACLAAPSAKKWAALAVSVPVVYALNIFRNAGIIYGYKDLQWGPFGLDPFEWMHSWVGKVGSLLALVLIALAVFTLLPELHSNILDLFDLRKRRAPGFFKEPPKKGATSAPSGDVVDVAR
jgi:archaeosortase A (PGF-CTERM-specific)